MNHHPKYLLNDHSGIGKNIQINLEKALEDLCSKEIVRLRDPHREWIEDQAKRAFRSLHGLEIVCECGRIITGSTYMPPFCSHCGKHFTEEFVTPRGVARANAIGRNFGVGFLLEPLKEFSYGTQDGYHKSNSNGE